MRFLEVVVALAIKEFQHRHPKLTSPERRKINSRTQLRGGYARYSRLNTLSGMV